MSNKVGVEYQPVFHKQLVLEGLYKKGGVFLWQTRPQEWATMFGHYGEVASIDLYLGRKAVRVGLVP